MAHPPSTSKNRYQSSARRDDGRSAVGESSRKYPTGEFLIQPQADFDLPLEALLSEDDLPLAEEGWE